MHQTQPMLNKLFKSEKKLMQIIVVRRLKDLLSDEGNKLKLRDSFIQEFSIQNWTKRQRLLHKVLSCLNLCQFDCFLLRKCLSLSLNKHSQMRWIVICLSILNKAKVHHTNYTTSKIVSQLITTVCDYKLMKVIMLNRK